MPYPMLNKHSQKQYLELETVAINLFTAVQSLMTITEGEDLDSDSQAAMRSVFNPFRLMPLLGPGHSRQLLLDAATQATGRCADLFWLEDTTTSPLERKWLDPAFYPSMQRRPRQAQHRRRGCRSAIEAGVVIGQ